MTDRRNPYVVLGLDFGADASAARSGFAKARRRLQSEDEPRYSMEDLTWALHQVEQIIEDPQLALGVFRVPADPSIGTQAHGGVFSPTPEQPIRTTPPTTSGDYERIKRRAIAEIIGEILAEPLILDIAGPYETEGR